VVSGTVYFIAISSTAFAVSVAAASWQKGGALRSVLAVLKTPALLAVPPALLVSWLGWSPPPLVMRPVELLSDGMIPTMLIALGVQLAAAGLPRLDADMVAASAVRLIAGPLLALALAAPMGVEGIARSVGVLQAAMPAAVLASIIAVENDLLPSFVITAVLVSTIASVVTLTVVLALV
jgi:predicted permease